MHTIENKPQGSAKRSSTGYNTSRGSVLFLSLLFMGLGHIVVFKQYAKGILFALVQIVVLFFTFINPIIPQNIAGLISLGEPRPDLPILERDNSLFMMMDGLLTFAFLAIFLVIFIISVRSALKTHQDCLKTDQLPDQKNVIRQLGDGGFPVLSIMPAALLVLFFVIVPLVFAAAAAFTNYTQGNIPPNNTLDWVGTENFQHMLGGDHVWTGALGRVVGWTLAWAFFATLTCYVGGFIIAVILKNTKIRIAKIFRPFLILPYAVPAVISLLVWRNMLNGSFGVINRTLSEISGNLVTIPWLSDVWLARFMVILINLWVGFPYFMLLTTGSMTAVSEDVYEAAKIDGASTFQITRKITAPLVLYQTMPLIIMSFVHNVNNFGAIFFLTGGDPHMPDSVTTAAGGTDILITWIYNLTQNQQRHSQAAVLAVMIFVALAPFAIFNFMRTKSFKEGEI